MNHNYTLQYWVDEGWYVGRLKEFPSVMSQGETEEELLENIRDAYALMVEDASDVDENVQSLREMAISL